MRVAVHKENKRDYTWIIILVLIALPLIVEFAAGEELYNKSYDSIISAQKFMSKNFKLKLYENKEIKLPSDTKEKFYSFYSFLEEEKNETNPSGHTDTIDTNEDSTKDVVTSEILHLINSNGFYLIICGILLNFVNIYKVFILSMTVFSANFVSATLSYIFHSPKPYMAFYKIKSAVVFNEWSSPNNQIVVLVSFGFSLYKVLVANKFMEKKLFAKIVLIILLIGYAFIDIFLLLASGNCTYNHIIISLFMAVVIFMVIFYTFKVNLNQSKQFYDLIRFNLLYYLVINMLLFTFSILLSEFITDSRDTKYYGDNGKIQVSLMPSNSFSKNFCKYRKYFFLNFGNVCNITCFLMNIIAFIALKLDLHFTYKDNYNSWSEGNFEKPKVEKLSMEKSGQAEYNLIEESQWNHYGAGIAAIRLFFLIVFIFVVFILFIWVSSWADNEIYSFIFLIIIPMALHVFGVFYMYKYLFTRIKLARPPKIKTKSLLI